MAKNTAPIAKRCKALGIAPSVMGYSKKETKRDPKANVRRKKSEYALQLNEKQKVKFIYGILERQMSEYYNKAANMAGKTGDNLLILCERRLDNVVFRAGFATTRREARQLVNHGHYTVNGKRVDIASFLVKAGDVVAVSEKSKSNEKFKFIFEQDASALVPSWLDLNDSEHSVKVVKLPVREEIDMPVEEHLIVEYYSK